MVLKGISNEDEENELKLKYIDLFCGMGSFHYSFQKLRLECVMACDIYNPKDNYKQIFWNYHML